MPLHYIGKYMLEMAIRSTMERRGEKRKGKEKSSGQDIEEATECNVPDQSLPASAGLHSVWPGERFTVDTTTPIFDVALHHDRPLR